MQYKMSMLLIHLLALGFSTVQAFSESYEADYFTNATLHCNFTLHNLTYPGIQVPFKKYWILPNATILSDTFVSDDKYTITVSPFDLRLFIRNIDDPDFGVYHCIMLWNNIDYKMDAIRVGLNEDGPYYKKKLEEFERNLIIGCASAGAAVVLIIIGCIVCRCRKKKDGDEDPVPTRDVHVYSIDRNCGYHMNHGAEFTDVPKPSNVETDESGQYACVNKASVRASPADHVTLQSAHL